MRARPAGQDDGADVTVRLWGDKGCRGGTVSRMRVQHEVMHR
jgi:hypothetical protein